MALSNLITWECRTTGNANNGGGFHTGASGTDRSQQNSAQVVIDNSTITCTTTGANSNTLTFTAGYTATAADVGNVVKITGGTNINTGYYEITGQTATTWTVTGATNLTTAGGAGSAITGNMGGAADSPVTINSAVVAGNLIYIQAGTYNLAATLTLTGGTVASGVSKPTVWVGYSTTRTPTNTDTQPILASNNNPLSPSVTVSNYTIVRNIKGDGSGTTKAARIFLLNGTDLCIVERCTASVFTDCGFLCQQNGQAINCYATGGTSAASNGGFNLNSRAPSCIDCVADSNANVGFVASAATAGGFINCIASNNTTTNGHGFSLASGGASPPLQNCVAYNNAGDGIRIAGSFTETMYIRNCILVKNAGYGINSSTGDNRSTSGTPAGTPLVDYNAFYVGTGLGARNQIDAGPHDVTLTGDPFTNGAAGDFSLNSTAGAGASARAAGFPGVLLFGGTGHVDLGALQHADPAGGSGGGAPIIGSSIVRGLGRIA